MSTSSAALQHVALARDIRSRRCRSEHARKSRHPIASASFNSTASPVTASSGRSADELARFLAGLCSVTGGGVEATPEDVTAAQQAADELEAFADAATRRATGGAMTLPITNDMLAGTRWRLVGCLQRTLPAPGSWLASPFFWIAKEAQHESYRLSQVDNLLPPFKLAAKISAGDPPKTGEEWITAFGRREVAAAFPFSVVESLLNGCLLYTSPSPRDATLSRMPSSA